MSREDPQLKIRLSPELKTFIEEQAKLNHRTLNGEITVRLEESRALEDSKAIEAQADVKLVNLKNGYKRLIYGKFMHSLDIDYTQDLSSLKDDIELALDALSRSSFWKSLKFINKDILVYKGGHHIDVVDNGRKSLNWLTIEDHYIGK